MGSEQAASGLHKRVVPVFAPAGPILGKCVGTDDVGVVRRVGAIDPALEVEYASLVERVHVR